MARNKVMKLWTAIVTAFLALCAALGFVSTSSAAAAVPQSRPAGNSSTHVTMPRQAPASWSRDRSLPPTMKQRIRAEAHGSSPTCRHRPLKAAVAADPIALHALWPRAEPAPCLEPPVHLRR